jgi:hypothetical protein
MSRRVQCCRSAVRVQSSVSRFTSSFVPDMNLWGYETDSSRPCMRLEVIKHISFQQKSDLILPHLSPPSYQRTQPQPSSYLPTSCSSSFPRCQDPAHSICLHFPHINLTRYTGSRPCVVTSTHATSAAGQRGAAMPLHCPFLTMSETVPPPSWGRLKVCDLIRSPDIRLTIAI